MGNVERGTTESFGKVLNPRRVDKPAARSLDHWFREGIAACSETPFHSSCRLKENSHGVPRAALSWHSALRAPLPQHRFAVFYSLFRR